MALNVPIQRSPLELTRFEKPVILSIGPPSFSAVIIDPLYTVADPASMFVVMTADVS